MKKEAFFLAAILASVPAYATDLNNSSESNNIELSTSSNWSSVSTVTQVVGIKKNSNHGIRKNCKAPFEYNSETGAYRIIYYGTPYNVSASDKDGYTYMFYYQNTPHYFNI